MINPTNILTARATAEAVQTTFNAWHVVALGVGAAVTHLYHTVVNAGGVKKLWSNFWNGPSFAKATEGGPDLTAKNARNAENTKLVSSDEPAPIRNAGERLLTSAPTEEKAESGKRESGNSQPSTPNSQL